MLLITGGTGFIGSHACVAFAQAGHEFLILDNLCNSEIGVVDRLEILCGKRPEFIQEDIRDGALLNQIFAEHKIKAVIHFAGLKAAGESVQNPLEYYDNNVAGTLQLMAAMRTAQVHTIGRAHSNQRDCVCWSGWSAFRHCRSLEQITSRRERRLALHPRQPLAQPAAYYEHALAVSSSASVYGEPANVPIHEDFPRSIPYKITKRRIGDIAKCWAAPTLAQQLLNWKATRNLEAMSVDSWLWQNGKFCDRVPHACFPASQR